MSLNKQNICLDLSSLETVDRYGGIGRYSKNLAEALAQIEDKNIEWWGYHASDKSPLPLVQALEAVERASETISFSKHRWRRRWQSASLLASAQIALFHATQPHALPFSKRLPIIATAHDLVPLVWRQKNKPFSVFKYHRIRFQQKHRYQRVDHIIAISSVTKQDLIRTLGINEQKISVVYHGVDLVSFSPHATTTERQALTDKYDLPKKWLVCVSSDHYRKNHQRLFDAWAGVADQIDEGLVFIGKALYENTLESINAEVKKRGLEKRFRWLSNITDAQLPAFYRNATAYVAPSFYEGFGMTLVEAMACGCPVICASNPAYEEIGASNVQYFDPYNTEDIAQTIVQVTSQASIRNILREKGLSRAQQFTWTQCAEQTLKVYHQVLGL